MNTFLSLLVIITFTSFPIVLWGYGSLYLSSNVWNRARFIFGMGSGALAVFTIGLFQGLFSGDIARSLIGFTLLLIALSAIVWWMTLYGSAFIRSFLQRVIVLHGALFIILFVLTLILERYIGDIPTLPIILSTLGAYLIAASIEEGVKHISSIGLTSREFRFTRRDFLLFTFFITLGFVTLENVIYMTKVMSEGWQSVAMTGLSRLVFALPLHVFAASICVMMWWRALSYRFVSWQYISLFSLGYVMAMLIHAAYNTLLSTGYILPTLMLVLLGYYLFTQWIIEE